MARSAPTSDFWKRLSESRQAAGLSNDQEAIAKELDVWQSAVTKWKTGKGLPTLSKAIEIANKAGVCVDWLLTGRGQRNVGNTDDPRLAKLLSFWNQLPVEIAEEVLSFATFKRTTQKREDRNRDLTVADLRARRAANHKGPPSD